MFLFSLCVFNDFSSLHRSIMVLKSNSVFSTGTIHMIMDFWTSGGFASDEVLYFSKYQDNICNCPKLNWVFGKLNGYLGLKTHSPGFKIDSVF